MNADLMQLAGKGGEDGASPASGGTGLLAFGLSLLRSLSGAASLTRRDAPRPRPMSPLDFDRGLPETRRYWDADDALYNHESPFYRYCASGFPLIFADRLYRAEWDAKRARLERDHTEARKAAERATLRARHAVEGEQS